MTCPSSIRHRDSNPRPFAREPPPITTRPGLPPFFDETLLRAYSCLLKFNVDILIREHSLRDKGHCTAGLHIYLFGFNFFTT